MNFLSIFFTADPREKNTWAIFEGHFWIEVTHNPYNLDKKLVLRSTLISLVFSTNIVRHYPKIYFIDGYLTSFKCQKLSKYVMNCQKMSENVRKLLSVNFFVQKYPNAFFISVVEHPTIHLGRYFSKRILPSPPLAGP